MRNLLSRIKNIVQNPSFDSKGYWENRYKKGGNSGSGSYGHLALFKANVINDFVKENKVDTIIEFGCGDGNQLKLAEYPKYIGLDVSATIIQKCIAEFRNDKKKSFFLYSGDCFLDNLEIFSSDLSMSLDVLFHLVEQRIYEQYLLHVFSCAKKYVIIYSSNVNIPPQRPDSHEAHRVFTNDIERLVKGWSLAKIIKNEHPSKSYGDETGSLADFYIYEKLG
jgi:SAM-dependent methyltransferase